MTGWLVFALLSAIWLPVWINFQARSNRAFAAAVVAWMMTITVLAFTLVVSLRGWP